MKVMMENLTQRNKVRKGTKNTEKGIEILRNFKQLAVIYLKNAYIFNNLADY